MVIHFFVLAVFAADLKLDNTKCHKIVLVADLSGSTAEPEKQYELRSALKLAIDLAPYHAQVAIVEVNSQVVVDTGFYDPSTQEGSETLIYSPL